MSDVVVVELSADAPGACCGGGPSYPSELRHPDDHRYGPGVYYDELLGPDGELLSDATAREWRGSALEGS